MSAFLCASSSLACVLLQRDPSEVDAMLDEGRISCAWNIAVNPTGRRSLRFLIAELEAIAAGKKFTITDDQITGLLLGSPLAPRASHLPAPSFVDGTVFRKSFNCDSDHVLNLIRAGVLTLLPGTQPRRGPNGTPAITWQSAVRFIRTRRIGP